MRGFGDVVCEVDKQVYEKAHELWMNDEFDELQELFNSYRDEIKEWK